MAILQNDRGRHALHPADSSQLLRLPAPAFPISQDGQFHPPYLSASLALSPALDSHGGRDNAPPSPPPGYRTVGVMAPGVKVVEAVE